MLKKSIKQYIIPLLFILVSIFLWTSAPLKVKKTYVHFKNKSGKILKGRIYIPQEIKPKAGIVLVHGVIVNKEYMATAANFLAENDFPVLAFDLGGYGESYKRRETHEDNISDVLAAVSFLDSYFSDIKDFKIGVVGHSMGGTAAVLAGIQNPKIQSIVCLGMSADISPFKPCSVLWSTGLYDPIHPPGDMRRTLCKATNQSTAYEEYTYQQGLCKQKLYFSPTANHKTEMSDFLELNKILQWEQETLLNISKKETLKYSIFKRNLSILFMGYGFFVLCFHFLLSYNKQRTSVFIIFIIFATLCIGYFKVLSPLFCSTMILFFLFLQLFFNFWTPQRKKLIKTTLYFLFGVFIIIDFVNIINAVWEYTLHPQYILYIPIYLIQTWLNYIPLTFTSLRPIFFSQYTTLLLPKWTLFFILLIEFRYPGIILKNLLMPINTLIKNLQESLHTPSGKSPRNQKILLFVLLILFGFILWQRSTSGFLNEDTLKNILQPLIRRIVPTTILLFIFLRQFKQ